MGPYHLTFLPAQTTFPESNSQFLDDRTIVERSDERSKEVTLGVS